MTLATVIVNGRETSADIEPRTSLADFLRKHCHLTGTHLGCEHGVCGACTVMINGAPARSCIAYAVALDTSDVRSIEGFEDDIVMNKLRDAFHQEHALQCGFCTPGMLITARDIVTRFREVDEARLRKELAGNICRCTGYVGIVNAIQRVMRELEPAARFGKAVASLPAPAEPEVPVTDRPVAADLASAGAIDIGEPDESWSRLSDSFSIAMPKDEVWAALSDVRRVVLCLPGAEVIETDGRNIRAQMKVSFGPIKAAFAGRAVLDRDEAVMTGKLLGSGGDDSGSSRAKGRMEYRLIAKSDAETKVDLTIDYQLQGPLAQFSRSGLVREFVKRLVALFAANLEMNIKSNGEGVPAAASLGSVGLVLSVIKARLLAMFGR